MRAGRRRGAGRGRRRTRSPRSTRRTGRARRTRRVRTADARIGEHRRRLVHPTTRRRRGTRRSRRSRRLRHTRRRRRTRSTGRTWDTRSTRRAELRDHLRRHVPTGRRTRPTRARRRRGRPRTHPRRTRRTGRRRSRRTRPPATPRRHGGLARRRVRDVAPTGAGRRCGSSRPGTARPGRRRMRVEPGNQRRRRQLAPARHQRRRSLRRDHRRRRPVVVRTRERRSEDRRRKRHTALVHARVRVRTRPGSPPGRHPVRRRRLMIRLPAGSRPVVHTSGSSGRPVVHSSRRGNRRRGGNRSSGRSGRSRGSGRSLSRTGAVGGRLLRRRTTVRNTQLVRRLLKPLRRTQQERRLIQIDTLRRLRSGRRIRRRPVLLLVPPYHLTHRQPRPQRGLTAVTGDHQPLTATVRNRALGTVLRPHHETQLELADPDLTVLIRGHTTVDPLIRTLLRLRERHHRAHPSTGTARAKPPSTIRFATVSSSGGLPASRWRKASKSSPHGSRSRSTRSCTPQPS